MTSICPTRWFASSNCASGPGVSPPCSSSADVRWNVIAASSWTAGWSPASRPTPTTCVVELQRVADDSDRVLGPEAEQLAHEEELEFGTEREHVAAHDRRASTTSSSAASAAAEVRGELRSLRTGAPNARTASCIVCRPGSNLCASGWRVLDADAERLRLECAACARRRGRRWWPTWKVPKLDARPPSARSESAIAGATDRGRRRCPMGRTRRGASPRTGECQGTSRRRAPRRRRRRARHVAGPHRDRFGMGGCGRSSARRGVGGSGRCVAARRSPGPRLACAVRTCMAQ